MSATAGNDDSIKAEAVHSVLQIYTAHLFEPAQPVCKRWNYPTGSSIFGPRPPLKILRLALVAEIAVGLREVEFTPLIASRLAVSVGFLFVASALLEALQK